MLFVANGLLSVIGTLIAFFVYEEFQGASYDGLGLFIVGASLAGGLVFTLALGVWFWFARRFVLGGEPRGLGHAKAVGYVAVALSVLGLLSRIPTLLGVGASQSVGQVLQFFEYALLALTAITVWVGIQLIQAVRHAAVPTGLPPTPT